VRRLAVALIVLSVLAGAWNKPLEAQKNRERTRALVGHVVDGDQPIEKAVVYLKNTKNLNVRTYITDADGGYRFPVLAPNVDYEVYAEFNGARSDTKTFSGFDDRKQANFTLRIHRK
jgi:hypothetical protein